ncbi:MULTISPECIES: non-homologous end-joining DNA ligase [unclassified Nocardioides]|uniref:non-homologous end-joining DNA ligase n=1 Tax=unclassified Nocardioides TaxID=2615069 RepID=UPI0006FD142C|nr:MULTISPECIES: non-homologous end-joining DNA ligase [unclassified Nocardioides]KQY56454.1 DNA ligase [Nocardioides sp. Root140]KQZ75213.1 DNA ligase [Nocardioides sp. Root151]KRF14291.1 DNA ligase [Nocardioides sp. Soil796]
MRPMLATRGLHVPTGDAWVHEVKWDGMRVLADVSGEGVRLTSRAENDVTASYPELLGMAGRDLLLDGEVIALEDGRPSFGALAERMHVRDARRAARLATTRPVTFLAFDIVRLDGRDLSREPLSERREILVSLGFAGESWHVPEVYDDGAMLLEATRAQGLEGVVSKRLSSRYEFGVRSPHWLKFPHRLRTSWVICGWRHETGSQQRLGAILVGEPTAEGLVFRGRVGSGIAGKVGPMLKELLEPLAADRSPFVDEIPRVDAAGTHWVEPRVVVDVESLGLGTQGRLRQPSYIGVRADLGPDDLLGGGQ